MSAFVNADGQVNQNEIFYLEYIDALFAISAADRKNAVNITLEESIRHLSTLSLRERLGVLKMVQQLALSDDDLSTEEATLLAALTMSLGFDSTLFSGVRILTFRSAVATGGKNALYVEAEWECSINEAIAREYTRLADLLHTEGYEFFYLPEMMRRIENRLPVFYNTLQYLHPQLSTGDINRIGNHLPQMTTASFTREMFLNHWNQKGVDLKAPAFILPLSLPDQNMEVNFLLFELIPGCSPYASLDSFFQLRRSIAERITALFPSYLQSFLSRYDRCHAWQINPEQDFMYYTGFHKIILDTLVRNHAPHTTALLCISEEGTIRLQRAQTLEVKMPALSRALYLFFLHHPEGIRLDDLKKHREEILKVYKQISSYKNEDQLRSAVWTLTDYTGSTLSSAISRIKKAFTPLAGEELSMYLISGPKGEEKQIHLDRSKVQSNFSYPE